MELNIVVVLLVIVGVGGVALGVFVSILSSSLNHAAGRLENERVSISAPLEKVNSARSMQERLESIEYLLHRLETSRA